MHLVHAQNVAPADQNMAQFARALDALRRDIEAQGDARDVAHLERVTTLSRRLALVGQGLLHFSVEPVAFSAGVWALWLHKCLEQMEIEHARRVGASPSAAHGQGESADFTAWGIADRALSWLTLTNSLDLHLADCVALFTRKANETTRDVDPAVPSGVHHRLHHHALGYLAKAVVGLPLLAKPFFWKVALGNVVAEAARDIFALALTHGGRVRVPVVRDGTTREARYLAQIESARDIEVPPVVSLLCGALDKRVEHHLFPHLPPNRLRQLAPRVRALCAKYGVPHRSAGPIDTLLAVVRERRVRRQEQETTAVYAAPEDAPQWSECLQPALDL